MSQRILIGVVLILLVLAIGLDVSGIAPGAGRQVIPFLVLLAASLFVWRAVWPGQAARATSALDIPLEDATDATLDVTFGAGDLVLETGAEDDSLLSGALSGGVRQDANRGARTVGVSLHQPISLVRRRADWHIGLSGVVRWSRLKLMLGASTARVDCRGLRVESLIMETGGTTLDAWLPDVGVVSLQIGGGRSTLHVPAGAAVAITSEIRLGDVLVDEARFIPDGSGMGWASANFEDGPGTLRITLKGGLGTVEVTGA